VEGLVTARVDTIQLSHLEQTVYFASQRQGLSLLDADAVTRLANVSRPHAVNLLSNMARKGALYRIGRGRYLVIPPSVLYQRKSYVTDPHLVIDELMRADGAADRYYVAYQSAAAIHGAAQQIPFVLQVALPIQRRPIKLGQGRIQFIRIRPQRLFGFRQMRYQEASLNVSDREKTLLDCLERFDLCGGVGEVARTAGTLVEGIRTDALLDYLDRMRNQALTQRLGLILERLSTVQTVDQDLIAGIARRTGPHTYLLDPHGLTEGPVYGRWRIRENIDVVGEL
jgi:predicted transcriptional regulator of viral defense system